MIPAQAPTVSEVAILCRLESCRIKSDEKENATINRLEY